jgi:hypothetical protein
MTGVFVKKGLENIYNISSHHQEFTMGKVDYSHNAEGNAEPQTNKEQNRTQAKAVENLGEEGFYSHLLPSSQKNTLPPAQMREEG